DVMALGPDHHFGRDVRAIVVHDHVQGLRYRIACPHPLQERQKILGSFVLGKTPVEPVGFQVIEGQKVTDIFGAIIVGTYALLRLLWTFAVMTMAWQQMQRAKFVDAQTPSVDGPMAVQVADGPEFLDK